ncbi:MAG: LexA family transcriptional regulator [Coxiellaceae bacterium]|nr:MAG: LexA family transcriptional regulator [Coxiellaceae bacterium]
MQAPSLSDILKRLMFIHDIKTTELARRIDVPQPTLQRIVAGTSTNPHISTLIPLAKFFNVTVDQLRGIAPIPELESTQPNPAVPSGLCAVPSLEWEEVGEWLKQSMYLNDKPERPKLYIEGPLSAKSYALTVNDNAMYPMFPKGTQIIVDPEQTAQPRQYVIAWLTKQNTVVLRQLLLAEEKQLLKALHPDLEKYPMQLLQENDQICGVVVQARRNLVMEEDASIL